MFYVTIKPKKIESSAITIEDIWRGRMPAAFGGADDSGATRTRKYEYISEDLKHNTDFFEMIAATRGFVERHKDLIETADKQTLYRTFYEPKKSGGFRRIDAPIPEMASALTECKELFERKLYATHHTAAWAYVKGRSFIGAVKKHQKADSRWVLKLDVHGFFPSTTKDFVLSSLGKVFPYCCLLEYADFREDFSKVLDLCFLNGGLPQGSQVSPTLTNLMMIPIDYEIQKYCSEREFTYTRYADDMDISARNSFKWTDVQTKVAEIFKENGAPFELNTKKTHYGSRSGRNWMLGLMYNQDGQVTVGHEKKKHLQNAIHNFATDYKKGVVWSIEDSQILLGKISYFKQVEGTLIDDMVKRYSEKEKLDIIATIKEIIK